MQFSESSNREFGICLAIFKDHFDLPSINPAIGIRLIHSEEDSITVIAAILCGITGKWKDGADLDSFGA
jgi:hypothetical protein